ncbi:aliphatic sulfonate ABC transporter substrate-binding protein [Erwiniaceae bacterium BAC15a-03b]|uniref:Putative aliphatic sulfonates-binding protein n=1 Tax=Winslowiella arboricola TaxID=2978220 RepID=A0A9J6PH02_9GAMM|nr:aliphatic sulfonate ABC transporter substrate-binding protein [Winslowiella arboricola]MCU5771744.1 aliphatic sulfonate ABC transporter substrate-binding protein [Winslowiella arboricola]MCU5777585.1 aliphatic sulfonate ABC transporter substrate-binding protein [Winslowiella arboricola]
MKPFRLLPGSALILTALLSLPTHAADETLRIGYQKSSTLLTLIKQRGDLDKALAAQGVEVSWHEFSSGLPLLEALNLNNVDLSADVADTVPVFAQAAGASLTYYARETPSPDAQAILVPTDSPIKTLQDLKGKKIAVTKAAGSHYLLIAALKKAGLNFSDITPAWLTPADGRAALENGSVAAWVTWEPFVTSSTVAKHTRVLASGNGLASYQRYYLVSTPFAKAHPQILNTVYNALNKEAAWLKANPTDAAKILSPLWGKLPVATVEQANSHRSYQIEPVKKSDLAEQQKIADAFFDAKLLPKRIDAQDVATWEPGVQ